MDDKTYLELSDEDKKKRAKLTPKEQDAVNLLVLAVKDLPRSLCLSIDDYGDHEDGLSIQKRITKGSAVRVAHVRKRSIIF